MNKKIISVIAATLLILDFCLPYPSRCEEQGVKPAVPPEASKDYVLSPNDTLAISVYGEEDLSATVRVSGDGAISYPLLGNIKVAGLTVKGLEDLLTRLLAEDYLVAPQVNVLVKEYARISVIGEVYQPGSYELKENTTLTKAIALAGGFKETANTSKVKIIRDEQGQKETTEVDVSQILEKSAPDVTLKGGDTVVVGEYGKVYLMGQVMKPGVYSLTKGLSVIGLLTLAGGFTPTASPDGTRVIRVEDGKKKVIRVPAGEILKGADASKNVLLEPDDTVVVPESFF